MNNTIIKLEDVDKFYMETGNKLHILKKLNLEVKRGEFVSILGKSGSGKSTLLNIMGLLDKIDGGKIWIDDKEVSSLNETERNNIKNHFLGFVFQFHYLMSEFTALENVMIPALLNNFKNKAEIEKEAKPDKPRIEKIHLYRAIPVLVISSLLILLSLYFITPLGSLKNLVVTGNERVTQDEIIKATQIDSRDYTITTFLNRNQYANNLKKANAWIEKAEISYQFPITFKIQVTEFKILAYEASTGNIYPVISNGTVINQPVKKEALPENYMRLNLSDKAKVKKLMQELSDVPDSIKNEIQTVDLTPSKATKDLLTLTMRDEHKIIVPLSDIHKKLPYYSRVHPLLTEPSIVDMEAGIFSYSASLVQKEEQEKNESSEETEQSETEAAPSDVTDETNN